MGIPMVGWSHPDGRERGWVTSRKAFAHGEGMIRQGGRAQTKYRKSTLP